MNKYVKITLWIIFGSILMVGFVYKATHPTPYQHPKYQKH